MKILVALVLIALAVWAGVVSFGYCCDVVFGKRPSGCVCFIGGAIASEVTVPLAVVLYLLQRSGVIHPPLLRNP